MVKVCGITNRDDALAAVDGGATALGFNFYVKSPRYIAPEEARRLIESLPSSVWKVGVFVNLPPGEVAGIVRETGLDIAQLHGEESPAEYPDGVRVWKALRVTEGFKVPGWNECPAEAILIDSASRTLYGGSGQTFDWHLAAGSSRKIILAGGLDGENVRQAIQQAHPWGVDACSRIESSPGRKDHVKMAQFLKAALADLS